MQVPLETAYAEACQALGEEIIKGRLLSSALAQKDVEIANLQKQIDIAKEAGYVIEEATEIVEGVPNANGLLEQGGHEQNGKVPGQTD